MCPKFDKRCLFWVLVLTNRKCPRSLFQCPGSWFLGPMWNKCLGSRVPGLTHKMGPGCQVSGPTKSCGSRVPLFGYASLNLFKNGKRKLLVQQRCFFSFLFDFYVLNFFTRSFHFYVSWYDCVPFKRVLEKDKKVFRVFLKFYTLSKKQLFIVALKNRFESSRRFLRNIFPNRRLALIMPWQFFEILR